MITELLCANVQHEECCVSDHVIVFSIAHPSWHCWHVQLWQRFFPELTNSSDMMMQYKRKLHGCDGT
jgi:hypothetical protein